MKTDAYIRICTICIRGIDTQIRLRMITWMIMVSIVMMIMVMIKIIVIVTNGDMKRDNKTDKQCQ